MEGKSLSQKIRESVARTLAKEEALKREEAFLTRLRDGGKSRLEAHNGQRAKSKVRSRRRAVISKASIARNRQ